MNAFFAVAAATLLPAAAAAGGAAAAPHRASPRASVVLITIDTTRADHLGCYGASGAATPTLDGLAARGVRFEQALSPVPLTAPAHASILTGRVPRRHGLRDNVGFVLDAKVPTLAEALAASGYDTAAFVSAAVLDRAVGLDRGFKAYDDTVRVGDRRAFNYEERAASQTLDAVLARLPTLGTPFFLWVHFYDPHFPYVPPEPFASRFKGRPYDGEIAFVDAQVARLLDALRRRGATPLVIVAGDHGESLGEHGEATHGIFLYQATQRVPMILYGPGVPSGRVVRDTVGLVDVAPTIAALLDLPPLPGEDGRSLLPAIRGSRSEAADYEMESFYAAFAYGWSPLRALVSGPWKYVGAPRPELYELPTDPRESKDLVTSRASRATALSADLASRALGDVAVPSDDGDAAERRARLGSLGYVGGSPAPPPGSGIDPKDGIAWIHDLEIARRAIQLGDPRDAVAPITRLLAKNPGNLQALLTLGHAQLATRSFDGALDAFRKADALAPGDPLVHAQLANTLAAKSASDRSLAPQAEREFERAVTLQPRRAETYVDYTAFLGREHRVGDIERVLERARAAGVLDPVLEADSGMILLAGGNADGARERFERALALDPRQADGLEGLGKIAFARGDWDTAAAYYAKALEAAPTGALAKTLGAIRMDKLGDRAGAKAAFERALALARPDDPDASDLKEIIAELSR
jgi:arylsulfatase A-like enzyme/Tfp pilus assembly protein PilF